MIHHDWPDQSRVERAISLMVVGIVIALIICWTCGCASLQVAWDATDELRVLFWHIHYQSTGIPVLS